MPDSSKSTPVSGGQLDLDLLRSFVTIADAGGFTRAAERLLRTQSTISLQVKRLEAQLGRRLFDRTPRSLRLTPEGETLLPEARALLALHDAILTRNAEGVIEGTIRLGTPEDFATSHLPEVLARFAKSHPKIALEVTCDLTLNLIERFRAGEFDLVLV
ncbi:MAG: LysR family transcriptional regulator, partial [Rhabdaerophilum sp.]